MCCPFFQQLIILILALTDCSMLRCPFDRIETPVPTSISANLPVNRTVIELLNGANVAPSPSTATSSGAAAAAGGNGLFISLRALARRAVMRALCHSQARNVRPETASSVECVFVPPVMRTTSFVTAVMRRCMISWARLCSVNIPRYTQPLHTSRNVLRPSSV